MMSQTIRCRVVQGRCKLSHEAELRKVSTDPTPPYTLRNNRRSGHGEVR